MKIRKLIPLSALLALSLTGCFLLPEEAEIPSLPLVTTAVTGEYETAAVQKGDLALKATVNCSYVALAEEDLSFPLSGESYGGIYVQVGDHVSKGELVAELNNEDQDEKIAGIDDELEELNIELNTAKQSLEVVRQLKALDGEDIAAYETAVTTLEDRIYILGLRRQELENEKDGRRLYAGIDGTVTYVKSISDSSTTMKNSAVVTISNHDKSVFGAMTEYYEALPAGEAFDINIGGTAYPAVVTAPEDLGFEPESREDRGVYKQKVYLVLKDQDVFFESNSVSGDIDLLLDSRKDVLWLPSDAIVSIEGQKLVYYEDASGLRSAKPIETGLAADGKTEIVSGLTLGDEVITG